MCGIVGWITSSKKSIGADRRRYIGAALIADTLRGEDSTGMFCVPRKQMKGKPHHGRALYAKAVCDGYRFQFTKRYIELMKGGVGDYRAIIGHNRAATKGDIDVKTAHPYQEGPITLVHNGTLHRTSTLEIDEWEAKAQNDSHTICYNLAKHDPKDVIERLDGAFALVWHDARDDTINIVRNNERPLHMTKDSKAPTIYIASEGGMLAWLLSRKKLEIKHGPIVQPEPGMWLKFNPDDPIKPERTKCKLYTPGAASLIKSGGSGKGGTGQKGTGGGGKTGSWMRKDRSITSQKIEKDDEDVKVLVGGAKVPVPPLMEEALMDLELEPSMKLGFVPKVAQPFMWKHRKRKGWPKPGERKTVHGYLCTNPSNGAFLSATVYGVPPSSWERHSHSVWTVRPIGVRFTGKHSLPIVIVKMTNFTKGPSGYCTIQDFEKEMLSKKLRHEQEQSQKPAILLPPVNLKSSSPSVQDLEDGIRELGDTAPLSLQPKIMTASELILEELKDAQLPGKYGATVDLQTWLKDTADGCANCGDPLRPEESDTVVWRDTDIGVTPLCRYCAQYIGCGWGCHNECLQPMDSDCRLNALCLKEVIN